MNEENVPNRPPTPDAAKMAQYIGTTMDTIATAVAANPSLIGVNQSATFNTKKSSKDGCVMVSVKVKHKGK